ncbi:EF-hand domain-containing protein [Hyunsoonleella sp. SJ7]|uniref:EF-hand domain-containing protein n=1 Tax=Hyunsoonleella aquatilis TaxID=2762758 RepID=A0A923HAH4_9FLAO|nr:EF-hand domain-containing protein [Hyunsoonleella aquatilis]MBC3757391.1 EF-hand domain-containing protein [Hyunsoonleella aquatilis]
MKFNTLKLSVLTLGFLSISFTTSAQEKQGPNFEKMFKRFDADKNGSISLEEFKSAKRKKEVPVDRLEKNYAKLDADGNGALTLEELKENWGKGKGKKNK